jgi:hypothetical protein
MITNQELVFEALSQAEAGRADAPDEVFLVSAFRESSWFMTCLRGTGAPCYLRGGALSGNRSCNPRSR